MKHMYMDLKFTIQITQGCNDGHGRATDVRGPDLLPNNIIKTVNYGFDVQSHGWVEKSHVQRLSLMSSPMLKCKVG